MPKPSPSIVVISALFLALGCLDLYRGLAPLFGAGAPGHLAGDDVLVIAIGVAAAVGGVFVFYGRNWARWLLAAWMAFHVALSVGHLGELLAHVAIFGAVAFFLFRPGAAKHFRRVAGS